MKCFLTAKQSYFFANASDGEYSNETSGASVKTARENGERHARVTLTALRAFRKRLFCSLGVFIVYIGEGVLISKLSTRFLGLFGFLFSLVCKTIFFLFQRGKR